jgi:hypothetical protein
MFVFLVIGHWSLVIGLWSLVFGHWFLVIGLWSLVFGHWSLVIGLWYLVSSFGREKFTLSGVYRLLMTNIRVNSDS